MIQPLTGDQPDSACSRMKQNCFSRLDWVSTKNQVLNGSALQEHRGSRLIFDPVRDANNPIGGNNSPLSVRAQIRRIHNPIACLKACPTVRRACSEP